MSCISRYYVLSACASALIQTVTLGLLLTIGATANAGMILGFSNDGSVTQFEAGASSTVDVPIYLIQQAGENRLANDGIISFGLAGRFEGSNVTIEGFTFASQFPDFREFSVTGNSFQVFGNVPFNVGGPNPGLVPAKGSSVLLGTINLRTTRDGSTLFRLGDYDPSQPSFSDFSFAGASSADSLDHILFDTDAQRSYSFTVLQITSVPEPVNLAAGWFLALAAWRSVNRRSRKAAKGIRPVGTEFYTARGK
ncbi:MAG: hypothetical protein IT423_10805 [Pirellulaceae bacterium]|nr:hypothetical protein [Pirellulaceae bacterium]